MASFRVNCPLPRSDSCYGRTCVKERLRELLFPTLVISIIGSLWISGWVGELEDDIKHGIYPDRTITAKIDALAAADAADEAAD